MFNKVRMDADIDKKNGLNLSLESLVKKDFQVVFHKLWKLWKTCWTSILTLMEITYFVGDPETFTELFTYIRPFRSETEPA